MSVLDGFFPAPGRAFIKHVETEDTYRGGTILIPDQARDKVARQQFLVVSLGDYERCADPDECPRPHFRGFLHKHRLMCGDWVLVRNRAWDATPDPHLFVVRQDAILGVFTECSPPSASSASASSARGSTKSS